MILILLKISSALAETQAVNPNQTLPTISGTEASIESIMNFLTKMIDIALNLAVVVGVIMIIYSAFLYVSSLGEESKAETAKKTLLWSIIGTVVVFLARILVNILDKFLG